jgi:translation initiation factor 2 subunit 1
LLLIKKGFPEEGEIVFCTVTKVQYHSVFASIDDYERKQGMIHISEISPGRIRNINDYVKEGKVVICKVLRINSERGHIDLSLRRVNENQRRAKVEERKQQVIAENILQSYVQLHKGDLKKLFLEVSKKALDSYPTLYSAFEDVVENGASLVDIGLDKKLASELEAIVKDRIKPKEVSISGDLTLESYEENGVDLISKIMDGLMKLDEKLSVQFLGAGKFKLEIVAPEYKEAEGILENAITHLEKGVKKSGQTTFNFERQ